MARKRWAGVVAAALVTAAISGCQGAPPERAEGASRPTGRQFSAADKAAARALSVGNAPALQQADSPFAKAALCADALDALVVQARANGGGLIDAAQARRIEAARDLYRARQRAATGGKPAAAPSGTPSDGSEPTLVDQSRIALACVRDLQQPTRTTA